MHASFGITNLSNIVTIQKQDSRVLYPVNIMHIHDVLCNSVLKKNKIF